MKTDKICRTPFSMLISTPDGETYPCCGEFTNYSFGNLYKQPLEEILNGKRIREFRRSILDGSYKYCNRKMCSGFIPDQFVDISKIDEKYPKEVNLSFDTTCNVRCIMCRDKNWILQPEIKKQLSKAIDNVFIPLLKDCKHLVLNCDGEFFASKESMNLAKKLIKLYPDLKFDILTNGILCTKEKLEELNILSRLNRITLSLHAGTAETHEKVLRVKNKFNTVMKNINDLTKLKNKGILNDFGLVFVLSSVNYKDIPMFAEILEKHEISGDIWQFRDWQNSKMCSEYEKYNIVDPNHPEFEDFLEVLRDSRVKTEYLIKNDKIAELYKFANKKKAKTKVRKK